jgi:hypothetical protein
MVGQYTSINVELLNPIVFDGSGHGLVEILSWHLLRTDENHEKIEDSWRSCRD